MKKYIIVKMLDVLDRLGICKSLFDKLYDRYIISKNINGEINISMLFVIGYMFLILLFLYCMF
jgi:hypothetical protein